MLNITAYQYSNGLQWATAQPAAAVDVAPDPGGELSVQWNTYYQKWLMTSQVDPTGQAADRRCGFSDTPTQHRCVRVPAGTRQGHAGAGRFHTRARSPARCVAIVTLPMGTRRAGSAERRRGAARAAREQVGPRRHPFD